MGRIWDGIGHLGSCFSAQFANLNAATTLELSSCLICTLEHIVYKYIFSVLVLIYIYRTTRTNGRPLLAWSVPWRLGLT
jgi:hypothetical protein